MTDQTTPPAAPAKAAPRPVQVSSRRRRGEDRSALDPATTKPDRHYHWFRRDHSDLTSMRMKGYTPENVSKEGHARPIHDHETTPAGEIVMGDLILASCPKDLYEGSRKDLSSTNEGLLNSTAAATEEEARAKGVKIIKDKE